VHQLATEARVRLDFEVDGVAYTAVRVVRRTRTGATTAEARLQQGDEVLASGPKELSEQVRDLLGLDFAQFTKTVVLPQGQFAAFLHDDPGDRQALLRRLLDLDIYARMGQQARARAARAKDQLEVYDRQLEEGADVTPERLESERDRYRQLGELREDVGTRLARLAGLDRDRQEAETRAAALVDTMRCLRAVTPSARVTALGTELEAAAERATKAEATLASARQARDSARQAADDGPDVAGCRRLLEARDRHDSTAAEVARLEGDATAARALATARAEAVGRCRDACEAAQAAYDEARAVAGASGLVAALVVGEPCPVCRQTVESLPEHDLDAELAAATDRREQAGSAMDAASAEQAAADRELAGVEARLGRERRSLGELAALLEGAPDADALRADLTRATELDSRLRAANEQVSVAEAAERSSRSGLEALQREELALRGEYTIQRDGVAALVPPAPGGESLLADWQVLAGWAGERQAEALDQAESLRDRLAELARELESETALVAERCQQARVDASLDGLGDRLLQALLRAESAVTDLERRLAELDELRARADGLREQREVADELGRLLSAKGFERWLLEEVRAELAARATETLLVLSGGQYSIVDTDDAFAICDHRNADERRDVRTLSGGETFLASLALALALAGNVAEMAAEGGARLESIFLDEGFGTLDPDTLDVVAAAIEELGASGRMVVIVTHIRELADRMPVRFEVTKSATTAEVERVEV
jgi:exonuclease SbcC